MKRYHRQLLLISMLLGSLILSGCIEKTLKPEAVLEIPTVAPYELIPTATSTASLPTTTITVNSINTIPCNLKSYSITYFSKYGEAIPSLAVPVTPMEQKLTAEGTISVTVKPYTTKVVELYELTSSDISPISARISLVFEDYNDNSISREAHCLLYEPDT